MLDLSTRKIALVDWISPFYGKYFNEPKPRPSIVLIRSKTSDTFSDNAVVLIREHFIDQTFEENWSS